VLYNTPEPLYILVHVDEQPGIADYVRRQDGVGAGAMPLCEPQSNPVSRTRWIVLAALVLCALNIGAHFPGTLNTDSVEQYREVLAGRLVDWHPPVMAFVWSLTPRVWGDPQPELTRWSSNSRATHGRVDGGSPAAKHEGLTYIVVRELT
jgi:hypothetical protein